MCLIIKSDNASELKQNLLTSAYHNNSDGFGGMFLADGKIQTFKELPKSCLLYTSPSPRDRG